MIHRRYPTALLLFLIFTLSVSGTDDGVTTRLHFAFIEAKGERSPFVVDGHVIFTHKQDGPARFVAAAFEHEDFTIIHPYQRYTPEGGSEVFLLAYPVPKSVDTLVYRVIVDGLWMSDRANVDRIVDANGIPLSRFRIPRQETVEDYPLIDGDSVTFVYSDHPGLNVSIAGTFNQWDPFMFPMREIQEGSYVSTLHLAPGDHIYHFIVNGRSTVDPKNPRYRYDNDGNRFSIFTIEQRLLSVTEENGKKRLRDRLPFLGG